MSKKPPRYDLPNAAPEPLRLVQRFVNTVNCESGEDWLERWLDEEGVAGSAEELDHARVVREAIRELLYENNRQGGTGDPRAVLSEAAGAALFSLDFDGPELGNRATGVDGAVGRGLGGALQAHVDVSWTQDKLQGTPR